jgi:hypothetical protein
MKTRAPTKTIMLGSLVAAAFDRAAIVSSDPEVVSRLAAYTVSRFLVRTQRFDRLGLLGDQITRASRTVSLPASKFAGKVAPPRLAA